ncbi:MAG: AAA family ATPase [Pseudomonadota bacterium]
MNSPELNMTPAEDSPDPVIVPDAMRPPAPRRPAAFASGSDELFPKGPRKRLFDQLRHLSKWSRRALLITGAEGAGRSTLFRHLRQALTSNATVAALDGATCESPALLYRALAYQLGVDGGEDTDPKALALLLREHLGTQQAADRLCAVLVDDAQQASGGALEALLSLSVDCRLRVLLFGDSTLPDRVNQATTDLDIACYESTLLPLSETDARAYVDWRARQLGYPGSPFSEEQTAQLLNASEGLPGRIDVLASDMLSQQPQPAKTGFAAPARAFPLPHLLVTLGLLAVVAALYLWIDSGPEPDPDLVAASMPQPLPERLNGGAAEPAVSAQPPVAAAAPASATGDASQAQLARTPPQLAPQLEITASPIESKTQAPAAAEQTAQAKTSPAARNPQVAASPTPRTTPSRRAPETSTSSKSPAPTQSTAQAQVLVPGVRDSDWLLTRDGTHFTVQLITLGSREGMTGFLAKQRRPSDFAVYERNVDGKKLYVATYGAYPSRAAAERGARTLPAEVGRVKPWIRPLDAVQKTIRAQ